MTVIGTLCLTSRILSPVSRNFSPRTRASEYRNVNPLSFLGLSLKLHFVPLPLCDFLQKLEKVPTHKPHEHTRRFLLSVLACMRIWQIRRSLCSVILLHVSWLSPWNLAGLPVPLVPGWSDDGKPYLQSRPGDDPQLKELVGGHPVGFLGARANTGPLPRRD